MEVSFTAFCCRLSPLGANQCSPYQGRSWRVAGGMADPEPTCLAQQYSLCISG